MTFPHFGTFGPMVYASMVDDAGAPPVASIVHTDDGHSIADATIYTFSSKSLGIAATGRRIIVGILGRDSATAFSISGVTCGGVAMAEVVDSNNAGSFVQAAIYILQVDAGTSADIVATFSEAITSAACVVWAAYDLASSTAVASIAAFQTASANLVLSLNVSAGGVAVGVTMNNKAGSPGVTVTWAGLAEDMNADIGAAVEGTYSGASGTTAGTPLTVGADWTGTDDAIGAAASFL